MVGRLFALTGVGGLYYVIRHTNLLQIDINEIDSVIGLWLKSLQES